MSKWPQDLLTKLPEVQKRGFVSYVSDLQALLFNRYRLFFVPNSSIYDWPVWPLVVCERRGRGAIKVYALALETDRMYAYAKRRNIKWVPTNFGDEK